MPFDHLDDDTDMYGRKIWTCRGCGLQTVKESDIGPHVCFDSELGKTTSDDEADRVLEAVQAKMASGMEIFGLQSERKVLQFLLRTTEKQAIEEGKGRGTDASSRGAGMRQGKIFALNNQVEMYRTMLNQVEDELQRRGVA